MVTGSVEATFYERGLNGELREVAIMPVRQVPSDGTFLYLGDEEETLGPYEVVRVAHSLWRSGEEVHHRCDVLLANMAKESLFASEVAGEA
jgi:hypothetical protein